MLEGNSDKKMISYMSNSLNIDFLLDRLHKEYTFFIQNNRKYRGEYDKNVLKRLMAKKVWDDEIVEAFDIYFLI